MKKQFGGFTPTQQQQLLTKYGYQGPAQEDDMQKYMTANPSAALAMGRYNEMARKRVVMAYGGMVKKPGVVYASQGTLIPGDLRRDEATGTYLTGAGGATTAWQAPEGKNIQLRFLLNVLIRCLLLLNLLLLRFLRCLLLLNLLFLRFLLIRCLLFLRFLRCLLLKSLLLRISLVKSLCLSFIKSQNSLTNRVF